MITLYHAPRSRSSMILWMLEEVGAPHRLHLLNLMKGEQRRPAYLAVNPMGKVPAIEHQGVVISEAAAICAYLADTFPDAGLAPPIGDALRGAYLKWLFFGPSCIEPAITDRMFERAVPPQMANGYGDLDSVLNLVTSAVATGPYLLGDKFTAADVVIGAGMRWSLMVNAIPRLPEIVAYTDRLAKRPALQRADAKDAELAAAQAG